MSSRQKAAPKKVCFLLHAHLPFAIRPELEFSLEEGWLHEAIINCYLPLLRMLERAELHASNRRPLLTLSLSPTLIELWKLPELSKRFENHIKRSLKIIETQMRNTRLSIEERQQATDLHDHWHWAAAQFKAIDGDLTGAFVQLEKKRRIELITTTATHAFLPAFQSNRKFRAFQIRVGIESFQKHTGISPSGFWLPECGFFPSLEKELDTFGIKFFGLEASPSYQTSPSPRSTNLNQCKNGVFALTRDQYLSGKVWSARTGYPRSPHYREFHKDKIFDLKAKEAGLFALPGGARIPLGLKYWRVTGKTDKDWYHPERALKQARRDANDFVSSLARTSAAVVFLPFDAELFGHWWHEGPHWLQEVFRRATTRMNLEATSVSAMLDESPQSNLIEPIASSWGRGSDAQSWVNHETDWIYPLLRDAFKTLADYSEQARYSRANDDFLQQACRELLVASASDWPFMISAKTTEAFGIKRVEKHLKRFQLLAQSVERGVCDRKMLTMLEDTNPIFKNIDLLTLLREQKQ